MTPARRTSSPPRLDLRRRRRRRRARRRRRWSALAPRPRPRVRAERRRRRAGRARRGGGATATTRRTGGSSLKSPAVHVPASRGRSISISSPSSPGGIVGDGGAICSSLGATGFGAGTRGGARLFCASGGFGRSFALSFAISRWASRASDRSATASRRASSVSSFARSISRLSAAVSRACLRRSASRAAAHTSASPRVLGGSSTAASVAARETRELGERGRARRRRRRERRGGFVFIARRVRRSRGVDRGPGRDRTPRRDPGEERPRRLLERGDGRRGLDRLRPLRGDDALGLEQLLAPALRERLRRARLLDERANRGVRAVQRRAVEVHRRGHRGRPPSLDARPAKTRPGRAEGRKRGVMQRDGRPPAMKPRGEPRGGAPASRERARVAVCDREARTLSWKNRREPAVLGARASAGKILGPPPGRTATANKPFDAERGDPRGKKAPVEDVSRRFSTLHA